VPPKWLVAGGLVLLGAMPHQIPATGRRLLHGAVGVVGTLALAIWLGCWQREPVLAAALVILLAGVWFHGPAVYDEPFVAPVLNKDHVTHKRRWISEEIMSEEPAAIQERTEGPVLNKDEVDSHAHRWDSERALDEHPTEIQERPVASPVDYEDSHRSYHS